MAEQRVPSSDANVAMLPAAATATAKQSPKTRHINVHIPGELLEMILLAAGEDWHFVFSMVCRRWRAVLSSWRSRGKRAAAMMCGSEPWVGPWGRGEKPIWLAVKR